MEQFPIESSLIKAVMHTPLLRKHVYVNPNWFPSTNLRAIFKAVVNFSGQGSDVWDKEAKDYGYRGNYHAVEKLYEEDSKITTVEQYAQYANTLESDYNNGMLQKLSAQNRVRPSQAALDRIITVATHSKDIQNNQLSPKDSTDTAVQSFLHDASHPKQVGIQSYPNLDTALGGGLPGGTLITIAASTGVGKTAYAVNVAAQILKHEKTTGTVRIDFFSLEMTGRQVLNRFLSIASGYSNWRLLDPYDRIYSAKDLSNLKKYANYFTTSGLHIYDDEYDLDQIVSTIRHNAQNRKPNTYIAIIDYIALVNVTGISSSASRSFAVGHVARQLHNLTNEYNIPIIELAQLNRNPMMRDDKEPVLQDIRESGAIAQHSNVVILLSKIKNMDKRLEDTSRFTFIRAKIAKNRSGLMATIPYFFIKGQMSMLEDNMITEYEQKGRLDKGWFNEVTKNKGLDYNQKHMRNNSNSNNSQNYYQNNRNTTINNAITGNK